MDEKELRRYCAETILNHSPGFIDFSLVIQKADMLYRYIDSGEIPAEEEAETPAPLPDIPRDQPTYYRTPKPVSTKPLKG